MRLPLASEGRLPRFLLPYGGLGLLPGAFGVLNKENADGAGPTIKMALFQIRSFSGARAR